MNQDLLAPPCLVSSFIYIAGPLGGGGHDEAYFKLPLTGSNVHRVGHYALCVMRVASGSIITHYNVL